MPPQFENNIPPVNNPIPENNPMQNTPVPLKPSHKYAFLLTLTALLILAGVFGIWYFSNPLPEEETEASAIINRFADWKTYRNEEYGFEVKYPSGFVYEERPDSIELVQFHSLNAFTGGIATKIYLEHSDFKNFDDFAKDMKENEMSRVIKANNKSLSEQKIKDELKKIEGSYSFETKKINGVDILDHTREFYGVAGGYSETDIWIGNRNYLQIVGGGLDLESFKFISTSTPTIIDTSNWKTYKNKQGYEIKIPNNWVYLECFGDTQLMLYSNPQEKEICDAPHGISSDLDITGPIKSTSVYDSYKKEKVIINDVGAYKFIVEIGDDPNQREKINTVLIELDGKIFNMDFRNNSEVINQIISTFKFIL